MSPLTEGTSYWMDSVGATDYPALDEDATADVCVVGGGITGLLVAAELAEAGMDVILLERGRLASSVTGFTTAKLTSQHGLKYSGLQDRHGAHAAEMYGAANERALARIVKRAADLGVGDAVQRVTAFVYAAHADTVELLHAEARAARRAGLPASFVQDVPLPYATHGAVAFQEQAQLHPRELLVALARHLRQRGVRIHECSKVDAVEEGSPNVVRVAEGPSVRADDIVIATLLPSPVSGDLTSHLYCHQGYAVAAPVGGDPLADGVYVNADRPMRSLRIIDDPDGRLLQVGGSAYVADPSSGDTPWDELEDWAGEHFELTGPVRWRWSTHDYSTTDGVPVIGSLRPGGSVYVATGFGGWGLTTAGVAAELLTQQIRGEQHPWHAMFDPSRELPAVDTRIVSAHRHGLGVAPDRALAQLEPGRALVLEDDGEEVAAYRSTDGELHRVSAVCTHLGGIVLWDEAQTQWHCPCHGSRFTPDGTVASGPAKEPLPRR